MQVKIINGVKLEDGLLHNAGEILDVDEALADSLIELGEAEEYAEPKVTQVRVGKTTKDTEKKIKDEDNGDKETGSPLVKLPYRTLQVKASELGMPKVVGVNAGELATFIEERLTPEDLEAFLNAPQE